MSADRQAYRILAEKTRDPRWNLPRTDIHPDPRSRFFDPYDIDSPPLPPDDPASNQYMQRVHGMRGWKHWEKFGHRESVENPMWTSHLASSFNSSDNDANGSHGPADSDTDTIQRHFTPPRFRYPTIDRLTQSNAIELGLIHSRDYQEELENVYLTALSLTFQRYRFQLRPLGFLGEPGTDVFYQHQPDDESNLIVGPAHVGVSRLFPSGAQFIAELTNNTIWLFSGPNTAGSATSFAYSIVQPLFKGGGRRVTLENLTQGERAVLYTIRDFARFRKSFYVTIVTGDRPIPLPGTSVGGELSFLIRGQRSPTVGFLFLLSRLQFLRNEQSNVRRLERRGRELEVLSEAGRATVLDVTQLQSSLELARSQALSRKRNYHNQLDQFKVQLGLPPDLELELDDSMLQPFQFIDPRLTELEFDVRSLVVPIPTLNQDHSSRSLRQVVEQLQAFFQDVHAVFERLRVEFSQMDRAVSKRLKQLTSDEALGLRQTVAAEHQRYDELLQRFSKLQAQMELLVRADDFGELPPEEQAQRVMQISEVRETVLTIVREIRTLQIAVRVHAITIRPVDMTVKDAVALAIDNRLDLMNQRAFVMDSRRHMEVAANRLQAVMDVVAEGSVNTPSETTNSKPFNFRADQSEFRAGVRFKTPLDRRRERNDFRTAQISFQRAHRNYMSGEDQVKLDVRRQFRELEKESQTFEIGRRALLVAARELDQAVEFSERPAAAGQSPSAQGLNISRALENVVDAQDEVVDSWVDYESARLSLYRDMGIMQIDPSGVWSNDPSLQAELLRIPPAKVTERLPPPEGLVPLKTFNNLTPP